MYKKYPQILLFLIVSISLVGLVMETIPKKEETIYISTNKGNFKFNSIEEFERHYEEVRPWTTTLISHGGSYSQY